MATSKSARASRSFYTAGIDVGGTKTSLVICDQDDSLLVHQTVPTDPRYLAGQVIGLVRDAQRDMAARGLLLAAVGVAVPGRVHPVDGTLTLAVNLGAPALPLARLVEEACGLACSLEHDARAAASWLARRLGPGPGYLAYLSVGTGISAGVVIEGQLLRGVRGLAGEVGHVLAQPDGPHCSCGLTGCLEAVAAGPAIARQANAAREAGRRSSLPAQATAQDVFRAADEGDRLAAEIADSAAGHLARAVRALVLDFGVECIVLGGGVAGAGSGLLDRVRAQIRREREQSALVDAAFEGVSLELLPPETEAGARGVAAIALAGALSRQAETRDEGLVMQGEGVGSQ